MRQPQAAPPVKILMSVQRWLLLYCSRYIVTRCWTGEQLTWRTEDWRRFCTRRRWIFMRSWRRSPCHTAGRCWRHRGWVLPVCTPGWTVLEAPRVSAAGVHTWHTAGRCWRHRGWVLPVCLISRRCTSTPRDSSSTALSTAIATETFCTLETCSTAYTPSHRYSQSCLCTRPHYDQTGPDAAAMASRRLR